MNIQRKISKQTDLMLQNNALIKQAFTIISFKNNYINSISKAG